jgi:hypothetical protein
VTAPNPPSGSSPLRLGGLVLLGIAAVAAVVGLVSLAGGGDSPGTTSAAAPPSSAKAAVPPPAMPPRSAAAPAKPAPAVPVVPAAPVVPPPVKPAAPAPAPRTAPAPLPAAGLPPVGEPAGPKGSPAGASGSGAKSGDSGRMATKVPVRVYNNSMVRDLAERVAADFRADGWQVTEVGNYPAGVIPSSTIYYRPDTDEQAAAQALATSFGMRAEPRFAGLRDASPGLIAIVTKDYQRR